MISRLLLLLLVSLWTHTSWAQGGGVSSAVSIAAPQARVASVRGVNLASTGDQATVAIPTGITKYRVAAVYVTNCSATPILAQLALYSAAGATGTTVVAAAVLTAATSAAALISSTVAATVSLTSSLLYVNVAVANATALTCDVYVRLDDLT